MNPAANSLPRPGHVSPVCILFALPEEIGPFQKRGRTQGAVARHSGAGAQNAAKAAANLLMAQSAGARCLIICGFCGGLQPELLPGSIILGDSVRDESGESHSDKNVYSADSDLLRATESVSLAGVAIARGMIVTADRVLTDVAAKRALAARTQAIAVDMETAGAARVAHAREVPWLAIRVVTDGVDDAMPFDFNALADAEGNVDKGRVVLATLRQPWKIPALVQLGARSLRAAGNLAAFLEALLAKLAE